MVVYLGSPQYLDVNPPIRVKAGSFLNDQSYFRKYVSLAAEKAAQKSGSVLILLDFEDDCPAQLGLNLLSKARAVRSDVEYLVVLAYREFETWFIAAVESLRGRFGLPVDLTEPANFESIRDAKGWLGTRMAGGYDPITHQCSLASSIDLDRERRSSSFDRFCARLKAFV